MNDRTFIYDEPPNQLVCPAQVGKDMMNPKFLFYVVVKDNDEQLVIDKQYGNFYTCIHTITVNNPTLKDGAYGLQKRSCSHSSD